MAIITEDYVSFETAKLLKEKRFDVYGNGSFNSGIEVFAEYSPSGALNKCIASKPHQKAYPAPTLQMACKWLREVHNIHIELNWEKGNQLYSFQIWKTGKYQPEISSLDLWRIYKDDNYIGEWNYEQACKKAIKYALKNLI